MSHLEHLICHGNRGPLSQPARFILGENNIRCADGFTMSVLAGGGAYCTPRPMFGETVPEDYAGPYTEVEVGYPSEQPAPWDVWSAYAEAPESPTGTVYSFVPVELVRALVVAHGGEVTS